MTKGLAEPTGEPLVSRKKVLQTPPEEPQANILCFMSADNYQENLPQNIESPHTKHFTQQQKAKSFSA